MCDDKCNKTTVREGWREFVIGDAFARPLCTSIQVIVKSKTKRCIWKSRNRSPVHVYIKVVTDAERMKMERAGGELPNRSDRIVIPTRLKGFQDCVSGIYAVSSRAVAQVKLMQALAR